MKLSDSIGPLRFSLVQARDLSTPLFSLTWLGPCGSVPLPALPSGHRVALRLTASVAVGAGVSGQLAVDLRQAVAVVSGAAAQVGAVAPCVVVLPVPALQQL